MAPLFHFSSLRRVCRTSRAGFCFRPLRVVYFVLVLCSVHAEEKPCDNTATSETRALFALLKSSAKDYLLVGHQDTTLYGVGWTATGTNDSDVKRTTGDFPAVYGWDLNDADTWIAGSNGDVLRAHVLAAHARGGINTFSWHWGNPLTGGTAWDTTPAVRAVLPGGDKHARLCERLDAIAAFFASLRDNEGKPVPIIFRPWHEHNGAWFWWGTPHHTAPEEFAALWRFTVEYLRDIKQIHHVLYAWSPNWSWKDEYFVGYPGDEYVDIFGFDVYVPKLAGALPSVRRLVEYAEARGKIPALTEVGYPDGLTRCTETRLFTDDLLYPLRDDPVARRVAWILLWRNAGPDHFWVPPPDHPLAEDFRAFYADSFTVFAAELKELWAKQP